MGSAVDWMPLTGKRVRESQLRSGFSLVTEVCCIRGDLYGLRGNQNLLNILYRKHHRTLYIVQERIGHSPTPTVRLPH